MNNLSNQQVYAIVDIYLQLEYVLEVKIIFDDIVGE